MGKGLQRFDLSAFYQLDELLEKLTMVVNEARKMIFLVVFKCGICNEMTDNMRREFLLSMSGHRPEL